MITNQQSFSIYSASAGSGKTFTLVKSYLKTLLEGNNPLKFRTLLALTFTNKAVNEMKVRIINTLKEFSNPDIVLKPNAMFSLLVDELKISPEQLHLKSKTTLQNIIHNYAFFDVSTIDKFNHRLIRTFAHDLKLPVNFEVELDTLYILGKAVDNLVDKAGSNDALTKILIDFALEKTDDDRSWDITYDLNQIAKLLINENDKPYLDATISNKSLQDFLALKSILISHRNELLKTLKNAANDALELINDNGIEHKDFNRASLPNYFLKIKQKIFDNKYTSKWQKDLIEGAPLYPKRVSSQIANTIDTIQPQLAEYFNITKTSSSQYLLVNNALKNLTPLSVLQALNNTLQDIKNEEDLLLISEFNSIINHEIKTQPAPFIYERIGEKYKHFFIDEFQDTSQLQWENLIPLIDNALTSQNSKGQTGSVMIVGDAKQAIYRWRGGKAEQFMRLYSQQNSPFQIKATPKHLDYNYRSTKTIVEFNNNLFERISDYALSNTEHKAFYKDAKQNVINNDTGYVELSFLEIKDDDKKTQYGQKTIDCIKKAVECGFEYRDIAVIIRKNDEGVAIAEHLTSANIPVMSSESLLLKNCSSVSFLINLLKLTQQPKNDEIKYKLLLFLAEEKLNIKDKHHFLSTLAKQPTYKLFKALKSYGITFNFENFSNIPLYEALEDSLRAFNLNHQVNAYIQFFLDEVFNYSQKHDASINGFLELWDRKADKLSISAPESINAVQIMTIHRSKGLEFPVVIFPFANQNIYFDKNKKMWYPVDKQQFHNFPYLYINGNASLTHGNSLSKTLYEDYQANLELDAINLLYVALTRAVNQLYIISEFDFDSKGNHKLNLYSGLFIDFLIQQGIWEQSKKQYHFGELQSIQTSSNQQLIKSLKQFISVPREAHNLNIITKSGNLWDTQQAAAIERGNLIHHIISKIKTKTDVDFVFNDALSNGTINNQQLKQLKPLILNIVHNPKLSPYFDNNITVYNERDIITNNGKVLRPDRLVILPEKKAVIIDYKTGSASNSHHSQLEEYASHIEAMGYEILKKILIYINKDITIKEL